MVCRLTFFDLMYGEGDYACHYGNQHTEHDHRVSHLDLSPHQTGREGETTQQV